MFYLKYPPKLCRFTLAILRQHTCNGRRVQPDKRSYHLSVIRRAVEKPQEEKNAKVSCSNLIHFLGNWPDHEQADFLKDMRIITNFISEEEEAKILEEIEPYMQRLHYENSHWDDAIHGFRETERKKWYPHNRSVLDRVSRTAFDGEVMPFVHVLDLKEDGVIKPHVDSTRHCGNTIAGLSLLTDCVMRLIRVDETKYKQPPVSAVDDSSQALPHADTADDANYRSQPKPSLENNFYADILLPRRSLYIMSYSSRYNFTHEILGNDASFFQSKPVKKSRRISVICRNEP